jgi:hypothetical protein
MPEPPEPVPEPVPEPPAAPEPDPVLPPIPPPIPPPAAIDVEVRAKIAARTNTGRTNFTPFNFFLNVIMLHFLLKVYDCWVLHQNYEQSLCHTDTHQVGLSCGV